MYFAQKISWSFFGRIKCGSSYTFKPTHTLTYQFSWLVYMRENIGNSISACCQIGGFLSHAMLLWAE